MALGQQARRLANTSATTISETLAATGMVLNEPYDTHAISQQLLQQGVAPNQVVSWVTTLLNQFETFGLKDPAAGVPTFVAGALQANIQYMVNDFRTTVASHVSFSSATAKISGFQAVLATIQNPRLPEEYKTQLSRSLTAQVQGTFAGLQNGATKLVTAVNALSTATGFDMTAMGAASTRLVDETAILLDQIAALGSDFTHSDVVGFLSTGLDSMSMLLQDGDVIQQSMQSAAGFLLDRLTSISTAPLSQYDHTIVSLSSQLDDLQSAFTFDMPAITDVATQLQTAVNAKFAAGADIQSAFSDVSAIGEFMGDIGDVVGVPALQQIGNVVSGVVQVAQGISALANPALMGLAFAGPVGAVAAIAMGVGTVLSSLFGSSGPSELQQVSTQIGKLSQQVQQVGIAVINAVDALGKQINGEFRKVETMLVAIDTDIRDGFARLGQDVSNQFSHLTINLQALISNTNQIITAGFTDLSKMLDSLNQNVMQQFLQTQGQITAVATLAASINTRLSTLSRTVDVGFQQLYSQQYEQLKVQVIQYYQSQIYGQVPPLNPTSVRQAFLSIVNWASLDSKNPIFHGDLARDYSLTALAMVPESDVLSYVNTLWGFLTSSQGYQLSINLRLLPANITRAFVPSDRSPCNVRSSSQRFVNPSVWMSVTQDLMDFVTQTPEFLLTSGDRCSIQKVVQSGEDFLGMVLALRTHSELFDQLMSDYQQAFNALIVAIYQKLVITLQLRPDDLLSALHALVTQELVLSQLGHQITVALNEVESANNGVLSMIQAMPGAFLNVIDYDTRHYLFDCCYDIPPLPFGSSNDRLSVKSSVCNLGTPDCNEYAKIQTLESFFTTMSSPDSHLLSVSAENALGAQLAQYSWDGDLHCFRFNMAVSNVSMINITLSSYPEGDIDIVSMFLSRVQSEGNALLDQFFRVSQCKPYSIIGVLASTTPGGCPHSVNLAGFVLCDAYYAVRCVSQQYIGSSPGADPSVWRNYPDLFSSFQASFLQFQSAYDRFSILVPAYRAAFSNFQEKLTALNAKLALVSKLRTDTFFNAFANITAVSEEMLSAMLNWLVQDSITATRQQVYTAISQNIQNAGTIKLATDALTTRHHALVLFLKLAFNEEVTYDVTIQQLISSLWTGDQFIQNLQAGNSSDVNDFIINKLAQAFFPTIANQTTSLINTTQHYLTEAIARGNALYANQTLGTGYWEFNAVLGQLRDMRDFIFPQGLSPLQITPAAIKTAYATNDTSTILALNAMLFNLDMADANGNTPVMLAVAECDLLATQRLVAQSVNVTMLNNAWNSVLNLALNCQNVNQRMRMLTFLVEHGAMNCNPTDVLQGVLQTLSATVPSVRTVTCMPLSNAHATSNAGSLGLGIAGVVIGSVGVATLIMAVLCMVRAQRLRRVGEGAHIAGENPIFARRGAGAPGIPAVAAAIAILGLSELATTYAMPLEFLPLFTRHMALPSASVIDNTVLPDSCLYSWKGVWSIFLPRVKGPAIKASHTAFLLRECHAEERVFTQHFLGDNKLTFKQISRAGMSVRVNLDPQTQRVLRGGVDSFVQGAAFGFIDGFSSLALQRRGFDEKSAQLGMHLVHCAGLFVAYGPLSVVMHVAMVAINNCGFGFSPKMMRSVSMVLSAAMMFMGIETLDLTGVLKFALQCLSLLLGSRVCQPMGESAARVCVPMIGSRKARATTTEFFHTPALQAARPGATPTIAFRG